MNITGNTILITGGGSGIGRALAEAFHRAGNQVIISGRRERLLEEVTTANPGMEALVLDIQDRDDVAAFARQAIESFPELNVVIHNAGIMRSEAVAAGDFLGTAEETIGTNLLGPIRLTAALLPHLLAQPRSAILTVSSGLAFVPLATTPTYSATKSAIHAWSMALREQLKKTSVEVIEIAPPYVQTELLGPQQAVDPMAMPLPEFTSEVMALLESAPATGEIIVERCKPLRFAAENGQVAAVFAQLNAQHG
ncbi:SDR family oxidoreductase [Bosea sp. LjRoot237]|uniref:SDR family oxidoreductase n=1 Tax=Bosea sp. LjRoot237 TaxID=3342292 RepID=UPI003ECDC43F